MYRLTGGHAIQPIGQLALADPQQQQQTPAASPTLEELQALFSDQLSESSFSSHTSDDDFVPGFMKEPGVVASLQPETDDDGAGEEAHVLTNDRPGTQPEGKNE